MEGKETDLEKRNRLRKQLDDFHQWPSVFLFKFILPNLPESLELLKSGFSDSAKMKERISKKGNYVSVTIEELVSSAEIVFDRYETAGKVPGIISL